MYIKEIVLDGFKSYANKTVVSNLDKEFNAISGCNGSGKSNILDSICFVLGITQLSQVRVANLRGLVYKNGEAGIRKASVTIKFDNSDKNQSPTGLEEMDEFTITRTVIIDGKNRYLLNGRVVQANKIQDLFHSVQLNVNNPHFLIMQGRITKVMNMKPLEILGMIEEAAGTRMYEIKKANAVKKIKNREVQMQEIDRLIEKELKPKLEKLRQQKKEYLKFSNSEEDFQKFDRFCIAYQFYKDFVFVESSGEHEEKLASDVDVTEKNIEELQEDIDKKEGRLNTCEEINGETQQKYEKLLHDKKAASQEQSKLELEVDNLLTTCETLNLKFNEKTERKKILEREVVSIKEEISALNLEKVEASLAMTKAEKQLQIYNDSFQAAKSGLLVTKDGEQTHTLAQSLAAKESKLQSLKTIMKEGKKRITTAGKSLEAAEIKIAKSGDNTQSLSDKVKSLTDQRTLIQQNISTLVASAPISDGLKGQFKDGELSATLVVNNLMATSAEKSDSMTRLKREAQPIEKEIDHIERFLRKFEVNYDRKRVKINPKHVYGRLMNLFKIKTPETLLALELICGGKLANIVVENKNVGIQLLKNGNFHRRETILPLKELQTKQLDAKILRQIGEIRKKQLHEKNHNLILDTAINFIDFDEKFSPAMQFVFGNTIVCNDMTIAKQVCFSLKVKVITCDGNVFQHIGTLTGGSSVTSTTPMRKVQKKCDLRKKLNVIYDELDTLKKGSKKIQCLLSNLKSLVEKFEQIEKDLECATRDLNDSDLGPVFQQKFELEAELKVLTAELESHKKESIELTKDINSLKDDVKNEEEAKKKRIKEAEKLFKGHKKVVTKVQKELGIIEKKIIALNLKTEKNATEVGDIDLILKKVSSERDSKVRDLESAQKSFESFKGTTIELEQQLSGAKKVLAEETGVLNQLKKKLRQQKETRTTTEILLQKQKTQLVDHQKFTESKRKVLKKLRRSYPWIDEEKDEFNAPGSEFYFGENKQEQEKRYKSIEIKRNQMKNIKQSLSAKVNKGSVSALSKLEGKVHEVYAQREKVQQERKMLDEAYETLDERKRATLVNTFHKVNEDFGSIFSTLLRGATAKLVPFTESKKSKQRKGAAKKKKRKDSISSEEESEDDVVERTEQSDAVDLSLGVEVKVGFSKDDRGNWLYKETLLELSGGQRSLLALSLILSFLLYKPAPMYILDEVDSALDLSHTQNIGLMLKKHFRQSQFIVVSLKEGMFNNANVLFRTKFVDGFSTVRRTIGNGKTSKVFTEEEESDKENTLNKTNKKVKTSV
eukprot:augustus_masked-scaffold_12-processed-gene-6.52-mRNA-1 protein AED:0.04 eAED:0.06 QI:0/-1/0/1/-1/1/1/0/1286